MPFFKMKPDIRLFLITVAIALLILSKWAGAQSTVVDGDMILSKVDASQMFAMTRAQWNENVKAATLMGVSKAMGKIDRGFGMVTAHPSGFMMVNPDFSEEAAPDFIQVTVAYRKPFANNLSIEKLKELVTRAKLELAPKYNVMGDVEEHEGGKAIFFTITK
tara:strand:- start:1117 stop:1602 length:486 start_codon:yes stop_codon:yes gene_type:complete